MDLPRRDRHEPRRSSPTRPASISAERARSASTRVRPARSSMRTMLDATRCISYLTIELEDRCPTRSAPRWAITCSAATCARTCARGTSRRRRRRRAWQPRVARDGASAADAVAAQRSGAARVRARQRDAHTSLARLRRNLAVAIGNSGDAGSSRCSTVPGEACPTPPTAPLRRSSRRRSRGPRSLALRDRNAAAPSAPARTRPHPSAPVQS